MVNTAILTIRDSKNYGNRLQNVALLTMLSRYGESHTLRVELGQGAAMGALQKVARFGKRTARKLIQLLPAQACHGRKLRFISFDRYISEKGIASSSGATGVDCGKTIIVIGSDQVWNYTFGLTKDDLGVRLGMFTPGDKTIAYAASIGIDEVDEGWKPIFKEGWSRISRISVREDRAAELVKDISGRDAVVVLDPTLMLTQKQWAEVFTDFVPEGDRYVLTYFLGCPSSEQESIISAVAKCHSARVRRINDVRDRETYAAGPAEFVELFSKAQYVFTDSYHACCFSILYNIPFKVFNRAGYEGRASMNSRMRTLFRLFELDDLMRDDEMLPTYDWKRINSLLEQHRERSREWLESALDVKPEAS